MITYYLKFTDRDEALLVLGTLDSSYEVSILEIGDHYKDTGTVDDQGYPILELVPGYHINVLSRTELTHLNQYTIFPESPSYVWSN